MLNFYILMKNEMTTLFDTIRPLLSMALSNIWSEPDNLFNILILLEFNA